MKEFQNIFFETTPPLFKRELSFSLVAERGVVGRVHNFGKKLYPLIILLAIAWQTQAQQYVQYTQFMFNKIALNPAYAGSKEGPTFSGLYRTQWVQLDGAPVSQSFSFHTPILGDKIGIGVSIHHDDIGPTNSWFYNLQYAYRVPLGRGHLALGLQALIRSYRVDWQEVSSIQSNDPLFGADGDQKFLPNIGAGIYYHADRFYAGASLPRILRGDLTFFGSTDPNADFSFEERHGLIMVGGIIPLTDKLKFKPDGLVKWTPNAPVDIDLHAGVVFMDLLNLGVTYRIGGITGIQRRVTQPASPGATPIPITQTRNSGGESLDFILQILFSKNFKLGLAYDYTLSQVRDFHSGTYEIMVEYTLSQKQTGNTNPRFF